MESGREVIPPCGNRKGGSDNKMEWSQQPDQPGMFRRPQASHRGRDADAAERAGCHPQPVVHQGIVRDAFGSHVLKLPRRYVPWSEGEEKRDSPPASGEQETQPENSDGDGAVEICHGLQATETTVVLLDPQGDFLSSISISHPGQCFHCRPLEYSVSSISQSYQQLGQDGLCRTKMDETTKPTIPDAKVEIITVVPGAFETMKIIQTIPASRHAKNEAR